MTTDAPQSMLAHLDELRWRVLKIFIAVGVGAVVAFVFSDQPRTFLGDKIYEATLLQNRPKIV